MEYEPYYVGLCLMYLTNHFRTEPRNSINSSELMPFLKTALTFNQFWTLFHHTVDMVLSTGTNVYDLGPRIEVVISGRQTEMITTPNGKQQFFTSYPPRVMYDHIASIFTLGFGEASAPYRTYVKIYRSALEIGYANSTAGPHMIRQDA